MKKLIRGIFAAALCSCFAGCTGGERGANWVEPFPDREQLMVVDSIGVEMGGDSNYVFGSIAGLTHSSGGGVIVLDMVRCCLLEYTTEGQFARSTGGHGDGPGELLMPMYVTLLSDGSILVADMSRAVLILYDSDLEFMEERRGWIGLVPIEPVGTDAGAFVAMSIGVDRNAESPKVMREIGRFGVDDVPEQVYLSEEMPMGFSDPTDIYRYVLLWYIFTADQEGNVFFAPWSTEEWHVTGMNRTGEVIFDVSLDLPRAEKTDAESADEEIYMEAWIARTEEGLIIDWDADPHRFMVTGLGVDADGRLWVQRGTEFEPLFDVFDIDSGEHLFTAEVNGYDSHGWVFTIDSHGILAFREDADSAQKVYTLRME